MIYLGYRRSLWITLNMRKRLAYLKTRLSLVLWVKTLDMLRAEKAKQVMKQFDAYDVHNW